MNKYSESLRRQARSFMVADKLSFKEISEKLSVDESIIKKWLTSVLTPQHAGLIRNNVKKRAKLTETDKGVLGNSMFDIDNSKMFCSILYGCEGAKYPSSNIVSFTNSDPELIRSFVYLLRKAYPLNESKWRIILQIHSDQNYLVLKKYWSELLKIDKKYFYKPTVTVSSGKKHRNVYMGTCSVRYADYRIQLRLIGVFDEFLRKSVR